MATPNLELTIYKIIKYGMLVAFIAGLVVLLITSVIVHDTYYILKHPRFFLSETLVMSVLTILPIVYISYLRGGSVSTTLTSVGVLFAKIVLLHVGSQLSGVYSILFPKSSNIKELKTI